MWTYIKLKTFLYKQVGQVSKQKGAALLPFHLSTKVLMPHYVTGVVLPE